MSDCNNSELLILMHEVVTHSADTQRLSSHIINMQLHQNSILPIYGILNNITDDLLSALILKSLETNQSKLAKTFIVNANASIGNIIKHWNTRHMHNLCILNGLCPGPSSTSAILSEITPHYSLFLQKRKTIISNFICQDCSHIINDYIW